MLTVASPLPRGTREGCLSPQPCACAVLGEALPWGGFVGPWGALRGLWQAPGSSSRLCGGGRWEKPNPGSTWGDGGAGKQMVEVPPQPDHSDRSEALGRDKGKDGASRWVERVAQLSGVVVCGSLTLKWNLWVPFSLHRVPPLLSTPLVFSSVSPLSFSRLSFPPCLCSPFYFEFSLIIIASSSSLLAFLTLLAVCRGNQ